MSAADSDLTVVAPAPTLGRGFIWMTSQAISRQLLLFVLFVVLGRLLEPADFGTVAIANAVLLLLQSLSSQTIATSVIQRADLSDDETATAFSVNLIFCCALAALVLAAALGAALIWPQQRTTAAVIAALSITLPLSALYEVHQALLMRDLHFGMIARKSVIGQIIGGTVAVMLALIGSGVWSLVAQAIMATLVEFAIVRHYSRWPARWRLDAHDVRSFWQFGGPLVAARLVTAADLRSPDLVLGAFAGVATTGQYRIARALFDVVVALVGAPLRQICLPVLSRLNDDRRAHANSYLMLSSRGAWLFFAPFAILAVWGQEITVLVFGEKWAHSGLLLQILAWQGGAYGLFNLYEALLVSVGQTRQLLVLRAAQAALGFAGMMVGVSFGGSAMIAGYSCGVLATMPVMLHFVCRALDVSAGVFVRAHLAPTLAAGAFLGVMLLLRASLGHNGPVLAPALSILGAIPVYGVAFLYFADRDFRHDLGCLLRRGGGDGRAA